MKTLTRIQYLVMDYIWDREGDLIKGIDIINYMKEKYGYKYSDIYYVLKQLVKEDYLDMIYVGANAFYKVEISREVYHLSLGID